MKIALDTATMKSADEFGEALRDYCFVPNEYGQDFGCYSTFDLLPEFSPSIPSEWIVELLIGKKPSPENDDFDWGDERKRINCFSSPHCVVAWFWDGDGSLYVSDRKRAALNNDCKKSYGWKWVKE